MVINGCKHLVPLSTSFCYTQAAILLQQNFRLLMLLPFATPLTLAFLSFSVLFASVLVFTVTSLWILSDKRRQLITAIRLYHPSFLYAYIALPIQSGVVQVSKVKSQPIGYKLEEEDIASLERVLPLGGQQCRNSCFFR